MARAMASLRGCLVEVSAACLVKSQAGRFQHSVGAPMWDLQTATFHITLKLLCKAPRMFAHC